MKRIIFYIEYFLFRVIAASVNLLSLSQASALADKMGGLFYGFLKKRRLMMLANLSAAFPEKSSGEIESIARQSMNNLVRIALEFVRIPKIIKKKEIEWKVKKEDAMFEALKGGRGVIVIVSHLGNWEWMALAARQAGHTPFFAIARPVKNPFVYRFIKKLRELTGVNSYNKDGAVRSTIKLLKENNKICMLIDQRERQGGVQVEFFGRPAMTTSLPAILALKHLIPVVSAFIVRESPACVRLDIHEAFPLINTGNYEADVTANTQQYVKKIEDQIRTNPESWLWMHNRWRL